MIYIKCFEISHRRTITYMPPQHLLFCEMTMKINDRSYLCNYWLIEWLGKDCYLQNLGEKTFRHLKLLLLREEILSFDFLNPRNQDGTWWKPFKCWHHPEEPNPSVCSLPHQEKTSCWGADTRCTWIQRKLGYTYPNGASQTDGESQKDGASRTDGASPPNGASKTDGVSKTDGTSETVGTSETNGVSQQDETSYLLLLPIQIKQEAREKTIKLSCRSLLDPR